MKNLFNILLLFSLSCPAVFSAEVQWGGTSDATRRIYPHDYLRPTFDQLTVSGVATFSSLTVGGLSPATLTGGLVPLAQLPIASDGEESSTKLVRADDSRLAGGSLQPLDADLTAIADLTTTSFGRSVLIWADIAAGRTALSLVPGTDVQAFDVDLSDLADGSLTGTKVGFSDPDSLWTAIDIESALAEMNDSINAGAPNGTGAKVHWSQILGIPSGIADGDDAVGSAGSGDDVFVDGANVTHPDFDSATYVKFVVTGTNVTAYITNLVDSLIASNANISESKLDAALARDSEVTSAISALSSVYQPLDAELTALAGVSANGLLARTGAGTVSARTLTGDSEIVVSNGDGVSGNPTLSIASSIARDAEVAAAYQPLNSDLTSIAALTTTSTGLGLLDDADQAALRTSIGVIIGTDVQAFDPDLADLADGSLSGSKVGSGIDAGNATTGTLPIARIADGAVTLAKLANLATQRVIGRNSGTTGVPEAVTIDQLLDWVSGTAAQGDILYRGASGYVRLPAGTSGQFLKTQGTGANPVWGDVSAGSQSPLTANVDGDGNSITNLSTLQAETIDVETNNVGTLVVTNATQSLDALFAVDEGSIASATTTDIGAVTNINIAVSGTTQIDGLGTVSAGVWRRLRFTGAGQITHNATSLILPNSGSNITRANGDTCVAVSLGGGNWRVYAYTKANGHALVDDNSGSATAWNDIGDATASGVIAGGAFTNQLTSTLDGGIVFSIYNTDADNASDTILLDLAVNDSADANSIFFRARRDIDGTPATVFQVTDTAFTTSLASTFSGDLLVGSTNVSGALALKAPLASPAFTGDPTVPTASANDNDTSSASTAYVQGELTAYGSDTVTLTGKTYDAAGTGNVLKFTSYQDFVFPARVDGAGTTITTNDYTSGLWGLATSSGSADTNGNYAIYRVGTVPYDLDTSVAMVLKGFAIRVSGTDTDAAQFTIGLWSPASSSAYSPTDFTSLGTFINFDSGTLTSPAANDIFYFSDVTLTGWAAAVTAGRPFIIGIARRNGSNDDSVTIVSGTIASGRTQ